LRLEDTDQGRYDERAVQDIYDTFEWLGIHLDEGPREGGAYGPYVQSERLNLYKEYAQKLLDSGQAYRCFASSEELEALRKEQAEKGLPQGYDRRYRDYDPEEAKKRALAGERHVIRFKVPLEGETPVQDILLGTVTWPNKDISVDPVIMKADGFPTYHLAHVVDDHVMETSHVLRGQEWLPSSPLHVLMFQAFGWEVPLYCHLSMIMGTDGKKLSKRHGSTSAMDFRTGGYVAEAIINFVSLLGWSYDGERDIFSKEDLESLFSLEKLSKSPAVFDYQKLDFYNAHWIRSLPDERLARELLPWLEEAGCLSTDDSAAFARLLEALPLARERLHKLNDGPAVLGFLFKEPDFSDPSVLIPKKTSPAEVKEALTRMLPELEDFSSRNDEENEAHYHGMIEAWGMKLGKVLMPLRLAVTGSSASPPLMASIRVLGLEKACARIKRALEALESLV